MLQMQVCLLDLLIYSQACYQWSIAAYTLEGESEVVYFSFYQKSGCITIIM
jgi:hypothetical protein